MCLEFTFGSDLKNRKRKKKVSSWQLCYTVRAPHQRATELAFKKSLSCFQFIDLKKGICHIVE